MFRFRKPQIWTVGLGAGLIGATLLALRYAMKGKGTRALPENVAPPEFSPRIFHSSIGEIFYRVAGEGPALVFVHSVGVGAASFEWREVYERFADRFRVLALDLIGFGESRRPSAELTAHDYARTLAEFIQGTCAPSRPVVIGSGMGGAFGIATAAHHPELMERVVALMPANLDGSGRESQPLGMRFAGRLPILNRFLYRNYLASRTAIRRWLEMSGFANASGVTEELVDIYHGFAVQAGAEHAIFNYLGGRLSVALDEVVRELAVPLHLVWIRNRKLTSIEAGERLTELAPRATLDVVENTGLLAPLESPEEVSRLLERLVSGPDLRVV